MLLFSLLTLIFTKFWSLEDIGLQAEDESTEVDTAYQQFNDAVYFEDGRYVVSWPWRDSHPELSFNFQLALGRLKSLVNRLSKDTAIYNKYDTLQQQLQLGIIEKVDDTNEDLQNPRHYLPHHCVLKPTHTTTKVRIIYDASAKTQKDLGSLNACLFAGPCMLPDLCGILLCFRLFPIAICSDVEKAILQLSLNPSNRDVTRFLWLRDISAPVSPENIQVFRFCRVPFGVVSSPFLLSATTAHHLNKEDNKL